jgi:hypothetical protein
MKKLLLATIICALSALAPRARADINLDDIAPKVTKCWGTTCLMPDAAINAVLFNLDTKKFEAGTVSLGGGLALLFFSDQFYASGLVAHITGVITQEEGKASFAMPTLGLVFLRYVEAGFSYRIATGEKNTPFISLAGNIPWDLFTPATLPQRAATARAANARNQELHQKAAGMGNSAEAAQP